LVKRIDLNQCFAFFLSKNRRVHEIDKNGEWNVEAILINKKRTGTLEGLFLIEVIRLYFHKLLNA